MARLSRRDVVLNAVLGTCGFAVYWLFAYGLNGRFEPEALFIANAFFIGANGLLWGLALSELAPIAALGALFTGLCLVLNPSISAPFSARLMRIAVWAITLLAAFAVGWLTRRFRKANL